MTECIRLIEWERDTFPAWAHPEAVREVLRNHLGPNENGPFAAGIRQRHAERYSALVVETKESVRAELAVIQPNLTLPDAILDYCTAQRHTLSQAMHGLKVQPPVPRRTAETAEAMAVWRRRNKAFAGLFVTYGNGDLSRTAEIARQHTPTKDHAQMAQYWHVRNALGSVAREIGPLENDDALKRLVLTTAEVRQLTLRAINAWGHLKQMPGYCRELNHEHMIEEALESGELGSWLAAPLGVQIDHPALGVNAAVRRLIKLVVTSHGMNWPRQKRGSDDVSRRQKTRRNAIISPAS